MSFNLKKWINQNQKELVLFAGMIPALLLITVFQLIPSIWTVWYSFTDIALLGEKALDWGFIGLQNYINIASDRYFWKSVDVTFNYSIISLVTRFSLGLAAALYLNSNMKGKTVLNALLLLPFTIPGVLHPYLWISMLEPRSGTINSILIALGQEPQSWTYGRILESLIMVNTWAGYAFTMLLLTSALRSIPKEYHEIAEIYGASRWMKFRQIILPLIKFPLLFCMIMIFKEDIDDFTYPYMFTGNAPRADYKTELLSLYAYHRAFHYYELGYGCAVGFIIALIIFVLTILQLRVAEK